MLGEETKRTQRILGHDPAEKNVVLQWKTPLVRDEAEVVFEPTKNVEENIGVESSCVSDYRGGKDAGEFLSRQVNTKITEKDVVSKASAEVVIGRNSTFVTVNFTGMTLMKHAY